MDIAFINACLDLMALIGEEWPVIVQAVQYHFKAFRVLAVFETSSTDYNLSN